MVKRSTVVPTPARLDGFLRGSLGISWGKARQLVQTGKVSLDGVRVLRPETVVAQGTVVTVDERAPRPTALSDLGDVIVYADAHVVVVRKPAGVSTVPYEPGERGTLDELVGRLLPHTRGPRPSLGVVHRLDKDTSGLLVFTRTWLAKKSLAAQFRAHTVHRRYLAIAHGEVARQTITSRLVADRGDGLRGSLRRGDPRQGQRAVTHVEVVDGLGAHATLVACTLETGRTHQIRIHLAERGHPLVGERVYIRDYRGPIISAPRLMLHAAELGFVHPKTGREMKWKEPPPADFAEMVETLKAEAR